MLKIKYVVVTVLMSLMCVIPVYATEYTPPPVYEPFTAVEVSEIDDVPQEPLGTLKSIIVTLFGEYTPRTQTVTVYMSDGTTVQAREIISGVAGMDWHYIISVLLFSIVLLSFFRCIGGVIKRG